MARLFLYLPAGRGVVFQRPQRQETLECVVWPCAAFDPVGGAVLRRTGSIASHRFRLSARLQGERQENTIGEIRNFGNPEKTQTTDRNPRCLIEATRSDPARRSPAFGIACGRRDHTR